MIHEHALFLALKLRLSNDGCVFTLISAGNNWVSCSQLKEPGICSIKTYCSLDGRITKALSSPFPNEINHMAMYSKLWYPNPPAMLRMQLDCPCITVHRNGDDHTILPCSASCCQVCGEHHSPILFSIPQASSLFMNNLPDFRNLSTHDTKITVKFSSKVLFPSSLPLCRQAPLFIKANVPRSYGSTGSTG